MTTHPRPLRIVWGNPLTMTGWDEGVDYTRIFRDGPGWHGSVIGFMPIVMHSAAVAAALGPHARRVAPEAEMAVQRVYWLTVVNLMELVAYIYMRAFSGHGDIGNFDVGLVLSPWWMFLFGWPC